jgi:hypothetical protein
MGDEAKEYKKRYSKAVANLKAPIVQSYLALSD